MNIRRTLLAFISLYIIGADAISPTHSPTKKPTFGPLQDFYNLPTVESNLIVNTINQARTNVATPALAMHKVAWNHTLQADIEAFVQLTPKDWWFSRSDTGLKFNGFDLMNQPFFKNKYPDWDFLIHDGCQSTITGVSNIVKMRALKQKHCFKYSHCNPNGFMSDYSHVNNYASCSAANYPLKSNLPCSWSWQYYPALILEDTTQIAGALLSQPGPNAAGGNRPNHFFFYRNNAKLQSNEQPYRAGKSGKGCPGKIVNKLCV